MLILTATFIWGGTVPFAEAVSLPSIQLGMDDVEDPEKVSSALQILFLLTILTQLLRSEGGRGGLLGCWRRRLIVKTKHASWILATVR